MFDKLLERLSLLLPQRRIYFIYTHKNLKNRFGNGVTANTEISHHCQKALSGRFKNLHFLRLSGEKNFRIDSIRPQDVVLGHIGETFLRARKKTSRMIAFYPWCGHEDRITSKKFNCIDLEEELKFWDAASSIVLLTSEYNKREYVDQPRNLWYSLFKKYGATKRIRFVHQPLDLQFFKRIKFTYTTSNFLYIGNDAHMKALPDSIEIVKQVDRDLHLYGVNGKKLDHLDEKEVNRLPLLADFFIQPGMWEGQCVSILEEAARGFIPIVSKETGYPYDHPYLLKFGDLEYNVSTVKKLLKLPLNERKELGDVLHQKLLQDEHHNDWKKLTEVLLSEVLHIMET